MRSVLALGLIAFLGVPAVAADFAVCNPAGTQLEMNACAVDDLEEAEAELNAVYAEVLKENEDDSAFVMKIREAQGAWTVFRDAELAAWFACQDSDPRMCWGSMYPMRYASKQAQLTRERTKALRAMLRERLEG